MSFTEKKLYHWLDERRESTQSDESLEIEEDNIIRTSEVQDNVIEENKEKPQKVLHEVRETVAGNMPPTIKEIVELRHKIEGNEYVYGEDNKRGTKVTKNTGYMRDVLQALADLETTLSMNINLDDADNVQDAFLKAVQACRTYLDKRTGFFAGPWTEEGKARKQMIQEFYDQLLSESVKFADRVSKLRAEKEKPEKGESLIKDENLINEENQIKEESLINEENELKVEDWFSILGEVRTEQYSRMKGDKITLNDTQYANTYAIEKDGVKSYCVQEESLGDVTSASKNIEKELARLRERVSTHGLTQEEGQILTNRYTTLKKAWDLYKHFYGSDDHWLSEEFAKRGEYDSADRCYFFIEDRIHGDYLSKPRAEYDTLKYQKEQCENEIEDIQKRNTKNRKKIKNYRSELKKNSEKLQTLRGELEEDKAQLKQYRDQLGKRPDANEEDPQSPETQELKRQIADLDTKIKDEERRIKEREDYDTETTQEIEELEKQNTEGENKIPELEKTITERQEQMEKTDYAYYRNFFEQIRKKMFGAKIATEYAKIDKNDTLAKRNVAASRLANLLGLKGLVPDAGMAELEIDGIKKKVVRTKEVKGVCLSEEYNNKRQEAKRNGKPAPLFNYSGDAMRQLLSLQVFDIICGNVNRHDFNFLSEIEKKGDQYEVKKITAINNEFSFGKLTYKEIKKAGLKQHWHLRNIENDGEMVLPAMDEQLKERILEITPEMITLQMADLLSNAECKALVDRLKGVQNAIRARMRAEDKRNGPKTMFVQSDQWDDWVDEYAENTPHATQEELRDIKNKTTLYGQLLNKRPQNIINNDDDDDDDE